MQDNIISQERIQKFFRGWGERLKGHLFVRAWAGYVFFFNFYGRRVKRGPSLNSLMNTISYLTNAYITINWWAHSTSCIVYKICLILIQFVLFILSSNQSFVTFAVRTCISVSAKRCPIQLLGPKPNGSIAKGLVFLYSSANVVSSRMNLSGRNFSGLLKNRGSSHICWKQRTNSVWNIGLNMIIIIYVVWFWYLTHCQALPC